MAAHAPRRARVLVVDDDRRSAATLVQVLRAAGFDAASVRSGPAALPVLLHEHVGAVVAPRPRPCRQLSSCRPELLSGSAFSSASSTCMARSPTLTASSSRPWAFTPSSIIT